MASFFPTASKAISYSSLVASSPVSLPPSRRRIWWSGEAVGLRLGHRRLDGPAALRATDGLPRDQPAAIGTRRQVGVRRRLLLSLKKHDQHDGNDDRAKQDQQHNANDQQFNRADPEHRHGVSFRTSMRSRWSPFVSLVWAADSKAGRIEDMRPLGAKQAGRNRGKD